MLKEFFKEHVARPLLKRLGTVLGSALLFGGQWACDTLNACGLVTDAGAAQVVAYVSAVALLLVDLTFEWIDRKAGKAK